MISESLINCEFAIPSRLERSKFERAVEDLTPKRIHQNSPSPFFVTPITIGLMFAGVSVLARAVNHDWRGYLLTFATTAIVLRKTLNPLWFLSAGAVAGMLGLV